MLLNPRSGYRQARRLYRRTVAPAFAAAGIKACVRETRGTGHARDIVARLDAQQVAGIDGERPGGQRSAWGGGWMAGETRRRLRPCRQLARPGLPTAHRPLPALALPPCARTPPQASCVWAATACSTRR